MTVEEARKRAERDATRNRMHLCPVSDLLNDLLKGLAENEERYGYPSCPCRIASGDIEKDRDIICPCDYRDPDVEEYGACYCALYVRKDLFEGKTAILPIPERRPSEKQAKAYRIAAETATGKPSGKSAVIVEEPSKSKMRLWYCKQCGYVCFREEPPYLCPICRAKKEMFAEAKSK